MAFLLGSDGKFLVGVDGYYLTDGQSDLSLLDVNSTIISQYANSPVIRAIIESFSSAADPGAKIDEFYDLIWNLDTAEGYGLDVWGRIVGVSRILSIPAPGNFGFSEGGYDTFGSGVFYSRSTASLNYSLTDDAYLELILIKAAANISGCSAPVINSLMQQLFAGRGRAYCSDVGSMLMLMTFEFELQLVEKAILTQSGAVPRPAGVGVFVQQVFPPGLFGFGEGGFAPFGYGSFSGDPTRAE
jgi:hypothetical protein